jgi:hypothetical protein
MSAMAMFQQPSGLVVHALKISAQAASSGTFPWQSNDMQSKIPIDPMTGATDWGLRKRGGVFDVYSESQIRGL